MKKFTWPKRATGLLGLWLFAGSNLFAMESALIRQASDQQLQSAIAAVQKWVTIPSITDATDSYRADKTRLLEDIAAEARQLGFHARLVADQRVAIIDYDHQDPAIGILLHADVVPVVDESDWEHPPFSGVLTDGAIWGRGASDDKGPIAATLYALAAIKQLNVELAGGVRVIVGTSEENMVWDDFVEVARLGLAPEKGWTADATFPVVHAEKSFINAVVSFNGNAPESGARLSHWQGGLAPNAIPSQAQVLVNRAQELVDAWSGEYNEKYPEVNFSTRPVHGLTRVSAMGKAGHGSRPESGVNAITHLARMLDQGARGSAAADSFADGSAAGRTLQFLSRIIGGSTDGSSLGIDRRHPVMGSTTVNVGQVISDELGVHSYLNIRGPQGLAANRIEAALVQAVAPLNGKVEMVAAMDPLWVEPDDPFVTELVSAYRRWQNDQRPPVAIGGTTYAKAFPGYVAFGMGFPDQRVPVHAPNERLPVEALRKGMAIYVDAILSTVGIRQQGN
ncbi:MAG: Sapep family Mn(2+)-dependent dipeptidase [Gammaproteobacteria bacterium]